jgi:hypothetical protein
VASCPVTSATKSPGTAPAALFDRSCPSANSAALVRYPPYNSQDQAALDRPYAAITAAMMHGRANPSPQFMELTDAR